MNTAPVALWIPTPWTPWTPLALDGAWFLAPVPLVGLLAVDRGVAGTVAGSLVSSRYPDWGTSQQRTQPNGTKRGEAFAQ